MINWQGPLRNIIYDKGGSLTGDGADRYITPHYPHFDDVSECTKALSSSNPKKYNVDTVVCSR